MSQFTRGGGGGGGGRGAYYKAKYGGRGRGGRGRGGYGGGYGGSGYGANSRGNGGGLEDLRNTLRAIDNKQYGAYKDLYGKWSLNCRWGEFSLVFDHIQADPFAAPSKVHLEISNAVAQFPEWTTSDKVRTVAFVDYLTRRFSSVASRLGVDQKAKAGHWGGAKGGDVRIDCPGQQVLERSSVVVQSDRSLHVRFTVGLPARGRTVLGEWALDILTNHLPTIAAESLFAKALNLDHLQQHIDSVQDQECLRSLIVQQGLVAFVRNGAILPRASGNSDLPMDSNQAIPFKSPPSLEKEFELPHRGTIRGMGIPRGVTCIVGGGFHGKSTILEALEKGVYNHIPGDGREFVTCSPDAVKIRAEDGRAVNNVNISPFINNLPFGRDTSDFSTPDASGSTSQAANILEAVEVGATTLLVDEDTCATNFMIRDERMMQLVSNEKEPITPFISKVRALYETHQVSTVLVVGGCGDYFEVSDLVVMMDSYSPFDVTQRAKAIANSSLSSSSGSRQCQDFGQLSKRIPLVSGFLPSGESQKVVARQLETIQFGDMDLDLSGVEQLVELSQVRGIADILLWIVERRVLDGSRTLRDILRLVEVELDEGGLDRVALQPNSGSLSRPRRFEIAAAVNRLRSARFSIQS